VTLPDVTVIMPMRNTERFVAESVRSVVAQRVDLELIVIDDGSTDRSADVVRGLNLPQVKLIDGPRRGISAAFNLGLERATSPLLARCDADDLYPPGRLERQVTWMNTHREFVAVASGYSTIDSTGRPIADHSVVDGIADITTELQAGRGRSHMCAFLFRTESLRRIGGCREWFETSEDADVQYRLAESGSVGYEPAVAYLYRLHNASITHRQASGRKKWFADRAIEFQKQRRAEGSDALSRGTPPVYVEVGPDRGQSSRKTIQAHLIGQAWKEHRAGQVRQSRQTGLRAALTRPFSIVGWKSYLSLWVKQSPAEKT
jgi:glycosyltransferase involved in cell wall biosynthesis